MLKFLASCILVVIVFSATGQRLPYKNKPQVIPGRMEFEFYDQNGYYDSDPVNNGSGKLNPANGTFLNEFRMKEGVDISYTKGKGIDDSQYNKVQPKMDQLYVGWTAPGEYIHYTVDVQKGGTYNLSLMYTANGDGVVQFDIGGNIVDVNIPSTNDSADTIAWRQWHHWNKLEIPGKVKLRKGKSHIVLKIVAHGNMNFDFLEFKRDD